MFDLVMIGAGMAGVVAALTARARGASVAIASRSYGATALSTGVLDIAYSPALSPASQVARTVAEHAMDIVAHRPRHPYGVLGLEASFAGVRRGFDVLGRALAGSDVELAPLEFESENLGLPSTLGTVLPAATALRSHVGLDLARPLADRWGVLQLHGDAGFDARRVALGLMHDAAVQSGVRPDLVVVPISYDGALPPMALARRLDDDAALDEFVSALDGRTAGLAGLLVPPVLGLERHGAVLRSLRERLGIPVVEALAHLPSVPGLRLQRALDAAAGAAGLPRLGEITAPVVRGERVEAVRTVDQLEVRAGAFVLATGRYVAGGVVWAERCREALFGLPVVTEQGLLEVDGPTSVVRETPVESHPLMTAGVWTGPDLRPLREGRPAFANLFAAGMVLGGFASRYALCADGVALASATLAAEGALRALDAS